MTGSYNILNRTVPMIAVRGIWVLPEFSTNFDAGREESINAILEAKNRDSHVFITTQIDPSIETIEQENLNTIGILCKIKQSIKLPDGSIKIMVEGISRAKILKYESKSPYFEVNIEEYQYIKEDDEEDYALRRIILEEVEKSLGRKEEFSDVIRYKLEMDKNLSIMLDNVLIVINPKNIFTIQDFVEEMDIHQRAFKLVNLMMEERLMDEYQDAIRDKITAKINQSQKEFYLREQLDVIKKELGSIQGDEIDDIASYKEKIEKLLISQQNKEHLLKELSRLEFLGNASPEINVIRTYLDNVLDVPFGKFTEYKIDIKKSKKVLDKDHHGLKDVKERILEYLSVLQLKKDVKGSILCLVGPPGVGKTSIVKSVAESMNREYISMRLGGVTDENEIRGHRKTYIGSMPGRIITNLQKIKTLNPVFLLDEIDKISSSYKADPASALLELLDPNQNSEFLDRYIEIPVDLSKVMFVTTANTIQTIPSALLDRMEVIQVSGYTEYDKMIIANNYLIPKQIEENGLTKSKVKISDKVVSKIIKNYTRESGVRNLERQIAKICRKAAMKIVEGAKTVSITVKNYKEFLGKEKVLDDDIVRESEVGIVTGLAWTSIGGELIQIEVNTMKGKGKTQLTGSLGDVMKESAIAAISFIKSKQEDFNIGEKVFEETDIHVHVPEGATPKDGPSAGITITTGIVSALTGRKVRQDIAMTGEVTIRGRVLPIGGLKEKALAAKRYGINNVIIPKQNEKDLEDIPEIVLNEMIFYPVSDIKEVLELALEKEEK